MKGKSGERADAVRTLEEQQEARAGVSNHGASVVAKPRQGLPGRVIVDRAAKPLYERGTSYCDTWDLFPRDKREAPYPHRVRGSVHSTSEEAKSLLCDAEVVFPTSASGSSHSASTNLDQVALVTVASFNHLRQNDGL